jgi:hypothetical protein
MRGSALILVGAIAFAASAVSASAAPTAPTPVTEQTSNIVAVAGGCGRGLHPNRWGRCIPNRYAYYRPRPYWQPYPVWPGYYGDGHEPWNRPTPADHVANQLNRQQLMYGY